MKTFEPGDKITPTDVAWSTNCTMIMYSGTTVTVETERFGLLTVREQSGSFFSRDFRLASFGEHQTAVPQKRAVLWKKGDKVTPKKGPVSSIDGSVTIASRQVVTIKEIKGDFLLVDEGFGIFSALDFTLVRSAESVEISPPPPRRNTPLNKVPPTHARVLPRNGVVQQKPTSRKTVKRNFERETGQSLEWCDGHLCYAGTGNKVAGAPYLPKDKPAR